jgi:hypothetical protein
MGIARKAGLTDISRHGGSRGTINNIRAEAWLATCRLADTIAKNKVAMNERRHGDLIELSPLWAAAIDLSHQWMRAAE